GDGRADRGLRAARGARTRHGGDGGGGHRPPRPDAPASPRRARSGHRGGLEPAVRRPDGIRRPSRRVPRHARGAQAPASRPHRRRLQGRGGGGGPPAVSPDPAAHTPRDKATSNICTAQGLLAVMAGMYAVYHGPEGLRTIARRGRGLTALVARGLRRPGPAAGGGPFFDTLRVRLDRAAAQSQVLQRARDRRTNLRPYPDGSVGMSLDETATAADVEAILECFSERPLDFRAEDLAGEAPEPLPAPHARTSAFLTPPVFHSHHSEHEMLRYLHRLQGRDLSL